MQRYSFVDFVEFDKIVLDKGQKVNDLVLLFEVDRIIKKYIDSVFYVIDFLSARLFQLESRIRNFEYFVDDLKVFIGNNYGSVDGKMR